MGRTTVRRVDLPPRRRARDALVLAGVAIVLLFAVVGVVSAGAFVGGKLSGGSSTKHPAVTATSSSPPELARANAQATAIIQSAHSRSRAVLARANRQARAIVGAARRRAASAPPTPAPTQAAVAAPAPVPPPTSIVIQVTPATGQIAVTPVATAGSANLSVLPASWLVVAYNASFGGGPGSAGSITVTNRSGKTFSGVARVLYTRGGSATAVFSSLGPGRTAVLPLNGSRYPGGGYRIMVPNPR